MENAPPFPWHFIMPCTLLLSPLHIPHSRVLNVQELQNIQIVRKQFILHRYEHNNITTVTTTIETTAAKGSSCCPCVTKTTTTTKRVANATAKISHRNPKSKMSAKILNAIRKFVVLNINTIEKKTIRKAHVKHT